MSRVSVTINRSQDSQKYNIIVAVYSTRKAGHKAQVVIDPGKANNKEHLIQMVGAAGGACAEYLLKAKNKQKQSIEKHDPSTCAKDAVTDFLRELALMEDLKRDLPTRIKAVLALTGLDSRIRERASLLHWRIRRGEAPTPAENVWVSKVLATYNRLGKG